MRPNRFIRYVNGKVNEMEYPPHIERIVRNIPMKLGLASLAVVIGGVSSYFAIHGQALNGEDIGIFGRVFLGVYGVGSLACGTPLVYQSVLDLMYGDNRARQVPK